MREIFVIAHNMRSTFNVGALLRTAEGLGIKKVFFTGYTPYPAMAGDIRLPHIAEKLNNQIHKTALGAEDMVAWEYIAEISELLAELQTQNISIAALEQSEKALMIADYQAPDKLAVLLGEEVEGIPVDLLNGIATHLVIPMYGNKESFNVVVAAAMALYELRFH